MRTLALSLMLALTAPLAWSCGVCAEDKMAATYDHAVVQRANAKGHLIVFCELGGAVDAKRIAAAAARQRSVDRASIRVSRDPPALSFALDAKQQSAQSAAAAIQKAAPRGTQVSILRVTSR